MKRFTFENTHLKKWFLFTGLVVCLGLNVTWNPEATQLAKFDFNSRHNEGLLEMASSDTAANVKINLGESDGKLAGLTYEGRFNADRTLLVGRVVGKADNVEGRVCNDCISSKITHLNPNDAKDPEFLAAFITGEVMEQIRQMDKTTPVAPSRPTAARSETVASRPPIEPLATECDTDDDDGNALPQAQLLRCLRTEAITHLADCKDASESEGTTKKDARELCFKQFDQYFLTVVKAPLLKALGQRLSPPFEQNLSFQARSLVMDIQNRRPKLMASGFYSEAARTTLDGIRSRGQAMYLQVLATTQSSARASLEASKFVKAESDHLLSSEADPRFQFFTQPRNDLVASEVSAINQVYLRGLTNPLQIITNSYLNAASNNFSNQDPTIGLNFNQDIQTDGLQAQGLQAPGLQSPRGQNSGIQPMGQTLGRVPLSREQSENRLGNPRGSTSGANSGLVPPGAFTASGVNPGLPQSLQPNQNNLVPSVLAPGRGRN